MKNQTFDVKLTAIALAVKYACHHIGQQWRVEQHLKRLNEGRKDGQSAP